MNGLPCVSACCRSNKHWAHHSMGANSSWLAVLAVALCITASEAVDWK